MINASDLRPLLLISIGRGLQSDFTIYMYDIL
jgi:hypothetical protein